MAITVVTTQKAHYVCEFNGCVIEHREKYDMLDRGADVQPRRLTITTRHDACLFPLQTVRTL